MRVLRVAAGPLLIAAAVLVVLHGFVFGGRVSSQHPDVLAFWLPTYCFLGKQVAAGHIPSWNPFVMTGVPFAADPQSGWLYLPAMLLFTALPCHVAIRWMIVVQPVIAGLGLYAFLRAERVSRPGATVGGLVISLVLAGSRLGQFLPFPAAIAWTTVVLAATARYLRALTWAARLGWALAAALAWGQLFAAHSGHGVAIGTICLIAYLLTKALVVVPEKRQGWVGSLLPSLLLVVLFVGVNLALLLPRLHYLPETSLGRGYASSAVEGGMPPAWPLRFATAPGGYLGAIPLTLSFAWLWDRRFRALGGGFAAFGVLSYLLGSTVAGHLFSSAMGSGPLRSWTHFNGRFSFGVLIALPVLAALGFESWRRAVSWTQRAAMAAPGLLLWAAVPPALGALPSELTLFWLALAVGGALLVLGLRFGWAAVLVPAALAVELTVAGVVPQHGRAFPVLASGHRDEFRANFFGWFEPVSTPRVQGADYVRPGRIATAMHTQGEGRYLSLDPRLATARGYLTAQAPKDWGLMANQRAMLFGLEDVEGYNPVQLLRYWTFVRTVTRQPIEYNAAVFLDPSPATLDLLDVAWIVAPRDGVPLEARPPPGAPHQSSVEPRADEGAWRLYRYVPSAPRASVVGSWTVVGSEEAALSLVASAGFDPERQAVIEESPGLVAVTPPPGPRPGRYEQLGPQAARVTVDASAPSIVVIRNAYERGWHATVDGRAARILVADYLLQGVEVPPGHHTIELTYDDPWIGYGLLGSSISVAVVLALASADFLRRRVSAARSG
jgi:hypothetical protein